jgi:hypothetical protein
MVMNNKFKYNGKMIKKRNGSVLVKRATAAFFNNGNNSDRLRWPSTYKDFTNNGIENRS